MKICTRHGNFNVSVKETEALKATWNPAQIIYKHTVTLIFGNNETEFEQYTHITADGHKKDKLDDEDLKYALISFLEQGRKRRSTLTFEEFCSEFGYEIYDDESNEYKKISVDIFNVCGIAKNKAVMIGISDILIQDILTELTDRTGPGLL